MTYRELKENLDQLTDEQLDMVVRLWGDVDVGLREAGFEVIDQNHYSGCDECYLVPEGELSPDEIEEWKLIVKKGTPMITV